MSSGTGILPVARPSRPWYSAAFAFLLSLTFSIWLLWAVGRSLGLFFGGLAFAAIVTAPLILSETNWKSRLIITAAVFAAIALIWLACIFNNAITLPEWLGAAVVLVVFAFAASGLAALLNRFRIPPTTSAALVILLAIAWLSWPIWLAPWLQGDSAERTVTWLVAANPTFAIQGALTQAFPVPWAQHAIAYRLTNIGDDIGYTMPASILRCAISHGLLAIIAWTAAHWPARPARPPADQ
jgi:hypothetical protein